MMSVNPTSLSAWTSSQQIAAPPTVNPAMWVVAVKLQNRTIKYNQFPTQQEALADIARHKWGVLIAPTGAPAAAAAPAAPQMQSTPQAPVAAAPVAAAAAPVQAPPPPPAYVSPIPGVPHATWTASRTVQPNVALQPNLWTVEVPAARKWVQFPTEQLADADIQRHRAGVKIAPAGVTPATAAAYTPIVPPAPPAAPVQAAAPAAAPVQAPAAPQVVQAPAPSGNPAVTVGALQVAQTGRVGRGTLNASAVAIPGGCRLTVRTNHVNPGDRMAYTLFMQRGPMWAQAAALTQGVSIGGYEGTITFDIDYAALSAQVGMAVAAGTNIEIHGHWQNTGHQWGRNSAGRPGGAVRLP